MTTLLSPDCTQSGEKILVCLYYGPSSKLLIQRGSKLASSLQAPLTFLTIDPIDDSRYSETKEENMAFWKYMAETLLAELVITKSDSKSIAAVIADTAKEKEITQIIIGQSARTKWEQLTKGSIINQLLHLTEGIDIHIVSVQRDRANPDEDYEQGVQATLVKNGEQMSLRLDHPISGGVEGVFYRNLHSDFNHGIFKTKNGKSKYQIYDGFVSREIPQEGLKNGKSSII